ncbi:MULTISPECIES: hypothetical protein [unclassified Streptomyces]|uniref:hypothetical protein n=1 Tax=unclassified Streptomyces TaxID=2593676 RepID=UPI000FADD9A2|nr:MULTISPECIES: hypothetical protein [unclassified Streptomyces]MDH6448846.1 hypothetical protein [Streptomyces sp. SAI-119]MDH6500573.1 hypothetical protein [Streptomyces sp. SAI-149]QUC60931.1 hypothetical protein IOD14_31490 [Streptomyces sp. A2-16]
MTRINRPDTLLTELRDIKRRLHALETAQRATAPGARSAAAAEPLAEESTETDTSGSE